ncbi:MAG: GNAT family N-acetyltransferase [Ruminococcaceae bacterium]|nr:GNAT family N-acetyltransferase [Oscillospiraceae bacterium]
MIHIGTKTIETDRLILRRFTKNDAAEVHRNFAGDPVVTEFLRWSCHEDMAETQAEVAEWVKAYDDLSYYNWAITLKESGEVIGSVGCAWMNEHIDMVHTYYCIGKAWWGSGIVTEAYKAVVKYFFEEVGANRIEAYHAPENPASGKVMQKCGLTYEGTLRCGDYNSHGIVDAAVYAILRSEYK